MTNTLSPKFLLPLVVISAVCIYYNIKEVSPFQKAVEQPCIIVRDGEKNRTTNHPRGRFRTPQSRLNNNTEYQLCNPQNFLVLIKSGAKAQYQKRRVIWRDSTCPSSYNEHNMTYRFMVGMPAHELIDPNSHKQAARASPIEISDMIKLENESNDNGDITFLSLKDVYTDFSFKTLRIFEWAVDRGMTINTSIVILHDDEYCLRPDVLQTICEDVMIASNSRLYSGDILWEEAGYQQQYGFDGSFSPYFSGHLYALSSDLVKDIVYDPNTIFTSKNLGYAEDLQVGKWVENQAQKDHPKQIKYVREKSLLWSVEEKREEGGAKSKPPPQANGVRPKHQISCGIHTKKWGERSNETLLTETQINVSPTIWAPNYCQRMKTNKINGTGTRCDRDYWRETGLEGGLIIHPPSKFAFCMLAKNGCSQWSTVIAKLYHNNLNINVPHYFISEKSLDKYGIEGVESIFSDPAATKVVMLRDPLARFASAYLDKCFEYNCGAMQCSGIRKHAGKKQGERVTFHEAIKWILDQDPARINGHWKLQSEHCNLRTHINDYTIIGRMEKETHSSDAACIMEKAGIDQFNKERKSATEPFWKDFHTMTQQRGPSVHKESSEVNSEVDVLKKLYTPALARALMEKMKQDYDILKLPEPSWIEDATGEWMDSNDHHTCKE